MKIAVIIPCCDQEEIVNLAISRFKLQTVKPYLIIVVNDTYNNISDDIDIDAVVLNTATIDSRRMNNRSFVRNCGIHYAIDNGAEVCVFIDGDEIPEGNDFLEEYDNYFTKNKCASLYGMRKYIHTPVKGIKAYRDDLKYKKVILPKSQLPHSLLNVNIDKEKIEVYDDQRYVHGLDFLINGEGNLDVESSKLNLILNGWLCWSCNFAIDVEGLMKVYKLNGENFFFDEVDFVEWGFEDGAFGLDSYYAGVKVDMTTDIWTRHFLHPTNNNDGFIGYVHCMNKILKRYTRLLLSNRSVSERLQELV